MLTCCRFLIGFLSGGFIPDVVLYLSYFYTKRERKKYIATFIDSFSISYSTYTLGMVLGLKLPDRHG